MKAALRNALLVAFAMCASAVLAQVFIPTIKMADARPIKLEEVFPASFGDWELDSSTRVILPAPDVQAKLDKIYNQVYAKTYINRITGVRVMLSIAYGGDQSDGMNAHLPEVCYSAQGFAIQETSKTKLLLDGRVVSAKQISTRLGSRYEPVTYWMTVGDYVAATRIEHKIQQLKYGLQGRIPDGMLVRVSTIDRDNAAGFKVNQDFIAALVAALPAHVKSRFIGLPGDARV